MENPKELVICPVCQTLHKRLPLKEGEEAHCVNCDTYLYSSLGGIEYKLLSYSFAGLLFFAIALLFPIVHISFGPMQSEANLIEAIVSLFNAGYVIVAIFSFAVLVLYPFFVLFFSFLFALFVLTNAKRATKRVLIALSLIYRWSMLDIFFVSILVAMVKIFEYAAIEFRVAFFAMLFVVLFEIYLSHFVKIENLWDYWEDRFCD